MRVIAILAAYNEERFIGNCLEHLYQQGVEAYLIDNGSTDETVTIARHYLGKCLLHIESLPRDGVYRLRQLLQRKEELAETLPGDWFVHQDPDEVRLSRQPGQTMAEALAQAEANGYNAVNFQEFTFVPTREPPDHDHPRYMETMRWYYPFGPKYPHQLKAWKRQATRVDLATSGGHRISFAGLKMAPEPLLMRHYLFLSVPHAIEKYVNRKYDPEAVKKGWHRWRANLQAEQISLPHQSELKFYVSDDRLDATNPWVRHALVSGGFEDRGRAPLAEQ